MELHEFRTVTEWSSCSPGHYEHFNDFRPPSGTTSQIAKTNKELA